MERLEKQLAKRQKKRANVIKTFQRSSKENSDVKSSGENTRKKVASVQESQWQGQVVRAGDSTTETTQIDDNAINKQLTLVKQLNSIDAEISKLQYLIKSISGRT